jgi:copper transport protein
LRRSAGVEALLAVVVLALTAVLVSQPPARLAQRRPVQASVDLGSAGSAGLSLSPGRAGSNDLRLRLTAAGRPVEPLEVTLTVALPAEHLGPLRVSLERTGPGGYRAAALSLPEPGRWIVTVRVRTSVFDATVGEGSLPVR